MSNPTPVQSQAKAKIESLLEAFQRSFDGGDYLKAREIAAELQELAPGHPSTPPIRERAELLGVDFFVVRFGFGVAALYLMGWLLAKLTVS
jgi:hypothetical protein